MKTFEPEFDLDIQDDREKYLSEFGETIKIFRKEFKDKSDKNLKRALFFALRGYKDDLIEKHSEIVKKKKNGKDLNDDSTSDYHQLFLLLYQEPSIASPSLDCKDTCDSIITELIMFHNSIFNVYVTFIKEIEIDIERQSTNFNGDFNRYKRCPNYDQIWFRIKGCQWNCQWQEVFFER